METKEGSDRPVSWKGATGDLLAVVIMCGVVMALFFPVLRWLGVAVATHTQLTHTLMVGGVLLLLGWSRSAEAREAPVGIGPGARWRVLTGLGLMGLALWMREVLVVFFALGFSVAGLTRAILARPRFSDALGGVVFVLMLSAAYVDRLDWPFRLVAGDWAAQFLAWLALPVELILTTPDGRAPALILKVGERLYEVAAECNGFGVVSGSLLCALFFIFFWRLDWLAALVLLPTALFCGMVLNAARIIGICLLAPVFPGHYDVVHEVVGLAAFWVALMAVFGIARLVRPPDRGAVGVSPTLGGSGRTKGYEA